MCRRLIGFSDEVRFNFLFCALKINFIFGCYLWLCWVFIALHGLSLVVASRGCSLVVVLGLLIEVVSLVA